MNSVLFDTREKLLKLARNERMDTILSDKSGIINAILKRNNLEEFGYIMYQSLSAKTEVLFESEREVSSGGLGIHTDERLAFMACVGEALERYCMSYCPKKEIIFARKSELPPSQTFDKHHLYSREQYKRYREFKNPDADEGIYWTKIKGAKEGEMYWPASLIYLPFSQGNLVAETSSSGIAAGTEDKDPVIGALLELIERDALMVNFLRRLNPPEIDLGSFRGKVERLIKKIGEKYNVKIYKLFSDITVPIYAALVWTGKGRETHFGIGASAELNSDKAIEKSLKEALFTFFYSQNILDLKVENSQEITKLYEHLLFYQGENFYKLPFSSKREKYKYWETSEASLRQEIQKKFGDFYTKDLTTSDVREAGFSVVKVIVPGLVDINKSHILYREAAERFYSVPKNLGLHCGDGFSHLPHPFP